MIPWLLAAMLLLAGQRGRDHVALAGAIDRVVAARGPLFRDDADGRRTRALMVAIAYRESGLKLDAVGDQGRSVCAFQILHGSRALLTDADACVSAGYTALATSARTCPAHPVAVYARGPQGCTDEHAQRISRDRVWLAGRVLREAR